MTDSPQTLRPLQIALLRHLRTPWTVVMVLPLLVLALDPSSFDPILRKAIGSFISTLPYIIFAILLIATLKAAGAETSIARIFQGNQTRMIVVAALFGGLAPFCSCEVIPFISALLALGAPLASIMAFWLSSPLIDPPTLLITAGALGWSYAVAKAVFAVGKGRKPPRQLASLRGTIGLDRLQGLATGPRRNGSISWISVVETRC